MNLAAVSGLVDTPNGRVGGDRDFLGLAIEDAIGGTLHEAIRREIGYLRYDSREGRNEKRQLVNLAKQIVPRAGRTA